MKIFGLFMGDCGHFGKHLVVVKGKMVIVLQNEKQLVALQ